MDLESDLGHSVTIPNQGAFKPSYKNTFWSGWVGQVGQEHDELFVNVIGSVDSGGNRLSENAWLTWYKPLLSGDNVG